MIYDTPYYTLRHAFEPQPILLCFGHVGLLDAWPLLEPSLYFISVNGRRVGMIECFADGRRRIVMETRPVPNDDDFIV